MLMLTVCNVPSWV